MGVLEVVLPGKRANDFSWGKKGFSGGPGVGGNKLTVKWFSSKTVAKEFPYTLRVPSTDWFKSVAQKMHISHIFVGSLFSVMKHKSSLFFLCTKPAHQSANFQTCDCLDENKSNSYVIFKPPVNGGLRYTNVH